MAKRIFYVGKDEIEPKLLNEVLDKGQDASCGESVGKWYRNVYYILNGKAHTAGSEIVLKK